jgi:S-adenosylmethionine hydrolase|tara:strand:+ start:727 stop:1125 length:399 start_codon:yes stop_codon:yes gene_type:complete
MMVPTDQCWKVILLLMSVLTITACQSGGITNNAGTVEGKVIEVEGGYGNLDTDITESLVIGAALGKGDKFLFSCKGKSFEVTFATTYSDVPRGDWVGFVNWAGNLRIARSFANAAETSGCGVNDLVRISAIP